MSEDAEIREQYEIVVDDEGIHYFYCEALAQVFSEQVFSEYTQIGNNDDGLPRFGPVDRLCG